MSRTETVESLLAPSLRVSRPVAACSRCRSSKVKCDGKLPACSACDRAGKSDSCTSANDDFARGKERSYTAALETAALRLQRRIDAIKSKDAHSSNQGPKFTNKQQPRNRNVSGTQRREAFDVNELVSDFGFLTVNATSRDFHGFTSEMSFTKLLFAMAVKADLSSVTPSQLPPRHAIIRPIERYFQRVYALLPFFSETDFMGSVSRVYQNGSSGVFVNPLDFWNIRLVLAISEATMSERAGDGHDLTALQHVAAALELADYVIHPGSMAGLQALLLLVVYALLDPAHFDCWYLIGMASRLVVDLGLHFELAAETRIDKENLNMRRRVFHSIYALDRLISMSLGHAFSFTDDSAAGISLPDLGPDSELQNLSSNVFLHSIRPCLYLFDIRRVQSEYYQKTRWSSRAPWTERQAANYSSVVSNDINAWHSTIPLSLAPEHMALFNLERLYCQILIIAPNQKMLMVNLSDLNKALVFEYCVQFAEQLHPITADINHQAFTTCADIWRARWVGRQFLEVMWSDFDRLLKTQHVTIGNTEGDYSAQATCNRAITFLGKISEILDWADRRWNLGDLRDKFVKESAVLVGRLKNRQQEFAAASFGRPQQTLTQQQDFKRQYNMGSGEQSSVFTHGMPSTDELLQYDDQRLSPQGSYTLPQGSLPRRSYEFLGRRS